SDGRCAACVLLGRGAPFLAGSPRRWACFFGWGEEGVFAVGCRVCVECSERETATRIASSKCLGAPLNPFVLCCLQAVDKPLECCKDLRRFSLFLFLVHGYGGCSF